MTTSSLLINLVFVLAVALVGAFVAARLRQSVIVGYILGGMILSPYTPGLNGDMTTVTALADLGVVLLMFTVGIHISLRDLVKVGRVAILGGFLQVTTTIAICYAIARWLLGWETLPALFFGAIIAISSGVVLSKILTEQGGTDQEYGRIALAWSTIQDLITITLVIILSALASGGGDVGIHLLSEMGKALLFLTVFVVLGSRVIPWLLERIADLRNREIFILAVATIALGLAYSATFFGLSLALGALVAGIVASESELAHHILGSIAPLRDIFAGIFFVSVGMLLNPSLVLHHLPLVLLVLVLIVVVKGFLTADFTRLFQPSLRTAVLVGGSLATAGEFSFLLARLGVDLGVLSMDVFSVMLTGAAGSILVAPPLQAGIEPAMRWWERHRPASSLSVLPELKNADQELRGHAVIYGYGRVGQVIADTLRRRNFTFVVVDNDLRVVQQARAEGVLALLGEADNPMLLEQVRLERARALVVAIPDPLGTRLLVDYALRINPQLEIVARALNAAERAVLANQGVTETVVGELELAFEMTRFTLRRFGVSALEAQAVVQRMRLRYEEGAAEHERFQELE